MLSVYWGEWPLFTKLREIPDTRGPHFFLLKHSFFGTRCDDFLASLALVVEVAVDLDLDQCISTKALNT